MAVGQKFVCHEEMFEELLHSEAGVTYQGVMAMREVYRARGYAMPDPDYLDEQIAGWLDSTPEQRAAQRANWTHPVA